jgi:hypothetical protein
MQAIPKVNINGTSQAELEKQCRDAWSAVDKAIDTVMLMLPHGRDYQLNESDYKAARAQHESRIRSLIQVKDEIMEIYEGVAAQRR